jgi:hypothetical protein
MKIELGFGNWTFKLDNGYQYETRIGCNGNMVYTDSLGNRYVPFSLNATNKADVDSMMFTENEYLVVTPDGYTFKVVEAKKL